MPPQPELIGCVNAPSKEPSYLRRVVGSWVFMPQPRAWGHFLQWQANASAAGAAAGTHRRPPRGAQGERWHSNALDGQFEWMRRGMVRAVSLEAMARRLGHTRACALLEVRGMLPEASGVTHDMVPRTA
eukprot:2851407-Prymnesium_polylepis.1